MSGDYARVLHKLSVVQSITGGFEMEADENKSLAYTILQARRKPSNTTESGNELFISKGYASTKIGNSEDDSAGEKAWDDFVYILWR